MIGRTGGSDKGQFSTVTTVWIVIPYGYNIAHAKEMRLQVHHIQGGLKHSLVRMEFWKMGLVMHSSFECQTRKRGPSLPRLPRPVVVAATEPTLKWPKTTMDGAIVPIQSNTNATATTPTTTKKGTSRTTRRMMKQTPTTTTVTKEWRRIHTKRISQSKRDQDVV